MLLAALLGALKLTILLKERKKNADPTGYTCVNEEFGQRVYNWCSASQMVFSHTMFYLHSENKMQTLNGQSKLELTGDCGDNFSNLKSVQNSCFSSTVQTEDQNPHLSGAKQIGEEAGKEIP